MQKVERTGKIAALGSVEPNLLAVLVSESIGRSSYQLCTALTLIQQYNQCERLTFQSGLIAEDRCYLALPAEQLPRFEGVPCSTQMSK